MARRIDARLARNPSGMGESRDGDVRIVFARPFAVLYRIDDAARTVYIEAVGWPGY